MTSPRSKTYFAALMSSQYIDTIKMDVPLMHPEDDKKWSNLHSVWDSSQIFAQKLFREVFEFSSQKLTGKSFN